MSGEPKTLTPEQVVDLAKKYMIAYLEETSWPDELREKWPEELDADYRLLFEEGVRVVARDEAAELRHENKKLHAWIDELILGPELNQAAELRAAVREWVAAHAAYSEWMVLPVREDWTSGEAKAREERLEVAEGNLRRLAGGKSER